MPRSVTPRRRLLFLGSTAFTCSMVDTLAKTNEEGVILLPPSHPSKEQPKLISTASARRVKPAQEVHAYLAWWMPDAWRTVSLSELDRLYFFEMRVGRDGKITERHGWPERWTDLIENARRAGLPIDMALTLMNAKQFDDLFSSNEAIATLQTQIQNLLEQAMVSGLQIDFEIYDAISPQAIQNFRRFVLSLNRLIRRRYPQKLLSAFLPSLGATSIYDALTLAYFSKVVVQGYDAHWPDSSRIGPVAPLFGSSPMTWTQNLQWIKRLGVNRERAIFSFPFYGYEWESLTDNPRGLPIRPGQITTYAAVEAKLLPNIRISVEKRVAEVGQKYDSESGSSFYLRRQADRWQIGWFEGEESLQRKLTFVRQSKLGGIAAFVLGYDANRLLSPLLLWRSQTVKPGKVPE